MVWSWISFFVGTAVGALLVIIVMLWFADEVGLDEYRGED